VKVCPKEKLDYRLFWGYIHGHTRFSDGHYGLDEYYLFARDIAGLDFCAATDHDYEANKTFKQWKLFQEAATKYNEPGHFVTFLGYEWSENERYGHRNVYYLRDDQPIFPHYREENNTPEKLWTLLRGREVIIIPHHTCRHDTPTDWAFHNPGLERLVEIYSVWGSCENSRKSGNPLFIKVPLGEGEKEGYHIQDGLAKGYRMGFTAGGDSHDGRPGGSLFHTPLWLISSGSPPWWLMGWRQDGLTAVYAKELTRESLWEALYHRRVYGTTGARIILEFYADGHPMGEEYTTNVPPFLSVNIIGTARLSKVELVKNNFVVQTHVGRGTQVSFDFKDEQFTNSSYYYVRVLQEDGEMAWSSPIFVNYVPQS